MKRISVLFFLLLFSCNSDRQTSGSPDQSRNVGINILDEGPPKDAYIIDWQLIQRDVAPSSLTREQRCAQTSIEETLAYCRIAVTDNGGTVHQIHGKLLMSCRLYWKSVMKIKFDVNLELTLVVHRQK
jgi:hypothetical protein